MKHAVKSSTGEWPRGSGAAAGADSSGPAPPDVPESGAEPASPSATHPTAVPVPAGAPQPAGPAPPGRRPRIYVVDGLRLLAAVAVALHHYAGTDRANSPRSNIWDRPVSAIMPTVFRIAAYGWVGVEIFFVISGFVICMSCWGRRPRDFFVSRVIRLYPAYWFGVLFTAVVVTMVPGVWPKPRPQLVLFNLSMFQSGAQLPSVDGVYWTLWSELRFYLVFLIVVAFGLTYRRVVLFCCVWGALALVAPASGFPMLVLFADPDGAWYFIAGLALFLMYRFGQDMLLWGILALSWLMAQNELGNRISTVEHVSGWRGALLIYTLFLLFMVGVALGLTDRLQWKWLVTAGALTYPFYLIHYSAGTILINRLQDRVDARLLVGGLILAGLLFAYAIHRLIEQPLARVLKHNLTKAFVRLGPVPERRPAP
ncbi:acyltransferase [Streptomyces sp. NBC_01476]|uniref:acyltransferase family protein n=1 Tax=Streptomyces sp. NBC_01476 TaxID=2903881 RepID=UPI002E323963|nr:acyltransferase [Streptomyces sp. NBC_01476]